MFSLPSAYLRLPTNHLEMNFYWIAVREHDVYDIEFFLVVLRLHGDLEHGQGSDLLVSSLEEGLFA